jgi:TRAP-type mannitol/chloroaromatic compound transport system permease large subunit
MATALAGAGFGAICGTSTASAATLSSTSLPAMIRQGYEPKMAAGVVAISGTLAMLLPTSVALVLFGLLAEVNIGQLLISGIVPAMLVTATIMATIYLLVTLDPSRAPRHVGKLVRTFSAVAASQPHGHFVRHSHRHNLSWNRHADGSLRIRRLRRTSGRRQTQADALLPLQNSAAGYARHLHDYDDPAGS